MSRGTRRDLISLAGKHISCLAIIAIAWAPCHVGADVGPGVPEPGTEPETAQSFLDRATILEASILESLSIERNGSTVVARARLPRGQMAELVLSDPATTEHHATLLVDDRPEVEARIDQGSRVVFDGRIGEDFVRIESDGVALPDGPERAVVNGVEIPEAGAQWELLFRSVRQGLGASGVPSNGLGRARHVFRNPERAERAFQVMQIMLLGSATHAMSTPGGWWNCVGCAASVVLYAVTIGVFLSAGAPAGGVALAAFLIRNYWSIARLFYTCVQCGRWLKGR